MDDQAEEVTRETLLVEAEALGREQQEHRGWERTTIEQGGRREKALRLKRYVPTHESELRARKIVALRKRAGRMEAS